MSPCFHCCDCPDTPTVSEIVAGNRDNRTIHYDSYAAEQASSPPADKDEAHDILDVASECIRSLLRISVLIRKATPRDRFSRAIQTTSAKSSPFLDQFDICHVAERYPKLKRNEAARLCERLGRAITKRRQFLRYSRQHRSRISGDAEPTEETEEKEATESILARNAFLVSHDTTGKSMYSPAVTRVGSVSEGAHTRPSTKASTLDVTKLALLELTEIQNDEARSYVSASSSFRITGSGEAVLRLPTLPEVSKGEAMFECPFCFGIQNISKESEWRQHAFHDLRAYVCTLGGTECDNSLFGNSRAWFDHEMQCHRRTWVCILCQEGPFRTALQMEGHTVGKHHDLLTQEEQLQVVVDASQRSMDAIPARDCPFCDEWAEFVEESTPVPGGNSPSKTVVTVDPTQFRRHLSFHQEQLALFAIPRTSHDDIHERDADSSLSGGLSSRGAELEGEDNDSDAANEAWPPDPPLLIAAAAGDLEEVELLLKSGADPAAKGETWNDLWEAAHSRVTSTTARRDTYVGKINRLVSLYCRTEWGDVFPGGTLLRIRSARLSAEGGDADRGRNQGVDSDEEQTEGLSRGTARSSSLGIPMRSNMPRRRRLSYDSDEHDTAYAYTGPSSLARYDLENPERLRPDPGSHPNPYIPWDPHHHLGWDMIQVGEIRGCFGQHDRATEHGRRQSSSYPEFDDRAHQLQGGDGDHRSTPLRHHRDVESDSNDYIALANNGKNAATVDETPETHSASIGHGQECLNEDKHDDDILERPTPKLFEDVNLSRRGSTPTDAHSTNGKMPERAGEKNPVKGILKRPTQKFPEEPNPIREGVVSSKEAHKVDKSKAAFPPGAKWTKISRKMVNPEALAIGKERYEVRDDFVIVMRVLSKEEIVAYAEATAKLRGMCPRTTPYGFSDVTTRPNTKFLTEKRKQEASKKAVSDWVVAEASGPVDVEKLWRSLDKISYQ